MFESKSDVLMEHLSEFYKKGDHLQQLLDILKSDISLRHIDWFVTNYSKKYPINIKEFDQYRLVYQEYKLYLKSYQKKQFDPFCRNESIKFYYSTDGFIETTPCQLCFFKWCIEKNIIKYIIKHIGDISNDMKMSTSIETSFTGPSTESEAVEEKKRKRQALSPSISRSIIKRNIKYTISFD
jgi:hypothetical protein